MNVLTRAQYEAEIDQFHANEKRLLLERWDMGALKYGPCELDERDWIENKRDEDLDSRAYTIIEKARLKRLAEKTLRNLEASRRMAVAG